VLPGGAALYRHYTAHGAPFPKAPEPRNVRFQVHFCAFGSDRASIGSCGVSGAGLHPARGWLGLGLLRYDTHDE
jgi:hypothetical protein